MPTSRTLLLVLCLISAISTCGSRELAGAGGEGQEVAGGSASSGGESPAGASQRSYATVRQGSCESAALLAVPTVEGCRAANLALGLPPQEPSVVSELFKASVPYGCSLFRYPDGAGTEAAEGGDAGQLVLNPHGDASTGRCGGVGGAFTCLCSTSSFPPGAGDSSSSPQASSLPPVSGAAYAMVRTGDCESAGLQVSCPDGHPL